MTQEKYIYNEAADDAARTFAKQIARPEGAQRQDAEVIDTACLIATRAAVIEASCWKHADDNRTETPITQTSTSRLKRSRIKRIDQIYDEAEAAITTTHQTFQAGRWSRCRHCPNKCLLGNASTCWPRHPCHAPVMRQTPRVPGPVHELVQAAAHFQLHAEPEQYTMDDSDENCGFRS